MDDEKKEEFFMRRSSIKRYTALVDRVVEDLNTLEWPSPKVVTKQMTMTLQEIGKHSENIKRNDLNPYAFQANHHYKMTKDKIKAYIDLKYNKKGVKDENRMTEILQNRPLTTFYKPSTKLLFDSLDQAQIHDVISNNKRKFGEFWSLTPKIENKTFFSQFPPLGNNDKQSKSPKRSHLSNLINKLLVKKLGIKNVEKNERKSVKFRSTLYNTDKIKKIKTEETHTEENDAEEILIRDETEYLGPEYAQYISDVSNKLKIEKYIGKNSGKKRRINYLNAKLSRL